MPSRRPASTCRNPVAPLPEGVQTARSRPAERPASPSTARAVASPAGRKTTNCWASSGSSRGSRTSSSSHPDGWWSRRGPRRGTTCRFSRRVKSGPAAGDEFRGEPLEARPRRPVPQLEGPLVRDLVPVGEERTGPGVGEDVAGEVRHVGVQQSAAPRHGIEAARPSEDVAEPVGHHGDPRFQEAECPQNGRPDIAARRCGPGVRRALAAGDLRQIAQMIAVRQVQNEGVGEGVHHGDRRVAVTALLQTGQVLDADARSRGEIGAPQPRRPAAPPVRHPQRLRLDAVAPGPDEIPQRRTHARRIRRPPPTPGAPRVALWGPA